ncbi:MAG: ribonuclease Y [Calditrichaceae bacterium]|nr:ribonuclease Y [Calditrichia bacterium]NUQ42450.1 ribonuclease Y [Calditrichaceae bacterium]
MDWGIALLVGILVGGGGLFLFLKMTSDKTLLNARKSAKTIIADAEKEAETLKKEKLVEAQEDIYDQKQKLEHEFEKKSTHLRQLERELDQKEVDIDRKGEYVAKKEKEVGFLEKQLKDKDTYIRQKTAELNQQITEEIRKLEEISGLTREEAKQILLKDMENAAREEGMRNAHNLLEQIRLEAGRKAMEIIVQAIQQISAQQSVESTVSVITLPNDDMKGRIIGREGRNIRAFEMITGVDVIIDDTPEVVVLSSYNSYRREIAKIALEKLIFDGRIHPARIEEVVDKTAQEMKESLRETGEQALLEMGIHGVAPELAEVLGKLKYRTSYGQNVLNHCKEVAYLCGIMAGELGLDVKLAKRAGIFHDIGKGLESLSEADHAQLGADLLRKFNENPVVVNAAEAHHDDREAISPITLLVAAADKISGSRPGARRESLESFIKRMNELEQIARQFAGVKQSYAIQAGREVRIIVETDKVDDLQARELAREIAKKIQMNIEFPGQIKVTVIREYRAFGYAT